MNANEAKKITTFCPKIGVEIGYFDEIVPIKMAIEEAKIEPNEAKIDLDGNTT